MLAPLSVTVWPLSAPICMIKPDWGVPTVTAVPRVKLVTPVKVPLASRVPPARVALLMTLETLRFWLRMKPGSWPTVTAPVPGMVVALAGLRFHWAASAMSPGVRYGRPLPPLAPR